MPVLSDPFASLFSSTAEFARLEEGLSGPGVTALFGLPPAGRMALAVQLSRRLGRPLCVVTAGEAEASRAAADLQALGLSAAVFPARDLLLRPIEGAGREYEYRRLAVLGGLVGSRVDAVCVPAEGLLQFTVPKAEFCANTLTLKPGMEIPQKQLAARLFGAGYVRRDRVEGPAAFWTCIRRTGTPPPGWNSGGTRSTPSTPSTCSPSAGAMRWKRSTSLRPGRCCSAMRPPRPRPCETG